MSTAFMRELVATQTQLMNDIVDKVNNGNEKKVYPLGT
jgi:hypothetical protein